MIEVKYHVICDDCGKDWEEGGDIPHPTLHAGDNWCKCDCGGQVRIYKVEEELVL